MRETLNHPPRGRRSASRTTHRTAASAALIIGMGLSACSTVKFTTKPERVTRSGIESAEVLKSVVGAPFTVLGAFADVSKSLLKDGRKLESRGRRGDAAGNYLMAAVEAHRLLASSSVAAGSEAEQSLIKIESSALARFAEIWSDDPRRLEPGPYHLTSGSGRLVASLSKDSTYGKGYFDELIASDGVSESGMVHKVREGCGAPMVGIRNRSPERVEEMEFYPKSGLHLPVTLTIDLAPRSATADGGTTTVEFSIRNSLVEQSVTVGDRRLPLAADFSAPIAMLLKGKSQSLDALAGYFKAEKRINDSGIFLAEPYDPNRIPVVFIHGLVSVPIIWRDIIAELSADPEISRRYQFMVFTYPSSYPIIQSASLLRENLAALREKYDPEGLDPLSTNMVFAGHSMGGVLTHTLVAEFGDRLWEQISDVPFEEIPMEPEKKAMYRNMVFFDPDPAVQRAIFLSAPHRGATKTQKGIAGLVSRMAKLPSKVLQASFDLVTAVASEDLKLGDDFGQRKVTSVQSLEPGSPILVAMDASPYRKGVIYHSIIGDRGKGDTPNSSDGLVEYWSSHQAGAASELIVPTDHTSYGHPLAVEELRRILLEHLSVR